MDGTDLLRSFCCCLLYPALPRWGATSATDYALASLLAVAAALLLLHWWLGDLP